MNSLYDEGEFDFFVEEGWTVTQSVLPPGMKFIFSKDEALGHIRGTLRLRPAQSVWEDRDEIRESRGTRYRRNPGQVRTDDG